MTAADVRRVATETLVAKNRTVGMIVTAGSEPAQAAEPAVGR